MSMLRWLSTFSSRRLPPVDGSGFDVAMLRRWLERRWLQCEVCSVKCDYRRDYDWRRSKVATLHALSRWLSTFFGVLMSMSSLCRCRYWCQRRDEMTQHILDDFSFDDASKCHSEYVGFWMSHFDTFLDVVIWPMTRLEQWYHYWPDWPTGTLRVELNSSKNFEQKIVNTINCYSIAYIDRVRLKTSQ